ncbi:hypothetical protein [Salana multivorans]|nr:hypothetical protein [Salana multivorans]
MLPLSESRSRATQRGLALTLHALRAWTARELWVAVTAGLAVTLVIGLATVLIPNPAFGRDVPPVWWNYPVWLLTSALSGMLVATYVRPASEDPATLSTALDDEGRRASRMGVAGGFLAWFAVGCPVCNKLALLALGYSGALTWFAPVQPFLAVGAMLLTGAALERRLRGQIACPVSPGRLEDAR